VAQCKSDEKINEKPKDSGLTPHWELLVESVFSPLLH
jgi:hypothetical protein